MLLYLYCLVAMAGILRVIFFVSYSFTPVLWPWESRFWWLAPPLGAVLYAFIVRRHADPAIRLAAAALPVRACLAWMMLVYGVGKLLNQQFVAPSILAQDSRIYQATGAWKAWAFFGHSPLYEAFLGAGEIVGGLLLLFQPTLQPGAALLLVMLTNIVFMNATHRIGVLASSSLYCIQAALLLGLERGRWLAFLRGQAFPARSSPTLVATRTAWAGRLLLLALVGSHLVWNLLQHHKHRQPESPLVGLWVARDEGRLQRLRLENSHEGSLAIRENEAVLFDYRCEFSSGRMNWSVRDPHFRHLDFQGEIWMVGTEGLMLKQAGWPKPQAFRRVHLPRR